MQWYHSDGFIADDDSSRVDLDVVHGFLSTSSYWATGIPRDVVARAIANSVNMGIYSSADGAQLGFAGLGLGRLLVSTLVEHPDLQGLRRTLLSTLDAHDLYRSLGFEDLADPSRILNVQRDAAALYGQLDPSR